MSRARPYTTLLGELVTVLHPRHDRDQLHSNPHLPRRYWGRKATICNVYLKEDTVCYDLRFADGTIWEDAAVSLWRLGEIEVWGTLGTHRCRVCGELVMPGQQIATSTEVRHVNCTG